MKINEHLDEQAEIYTKAQHEITNIYVRCRKEIDDSRKRAMQENLGQFDKTLSKRVHTNINPQNVKNSESKKWFFYS